MIAVIGLPARLQQTKHWQPCTPACCARQALLLAHDLARRKRGATNLQDPKKGRRQPSLSLFSWSTVRGWGWLRFQEGLRLLNRFHRRPLEGA